MAKQIKGIVVSDKMAKTLVVEVTTQTTHPIYKKVVRRTNRFKVHNEDTTIKIGDTVAIVETRPLSKEKRWIVAGQKPAQKEEKETIGKAATKKEGKAEAKPAAKKATVKKAAKKA